MSYLKCPVCQKELSKNDKNFSCPNKHLYDIAKKGYVNLILANQGHSLNEGDNKEMIDARHNFLSTGAYLPLRNKLIEIVYSLSKNLTLFNFIDVACGEGYYTNELHRVLSKEKDLETLGIDISKAAVNKACSGKNILKLNDKINYAIGNLDYLPVMDNSFDIMLNSFAPINEKEFFRVIKKGGYYIRVLPGKNHLLELKKFLYKEVRLNEPKEEHLEGFNLINQYEVNDFIHLSSPHIYELFMMTPYYYKTSLEASNNLKKLSSLDTTISFKILVYQK